MPDPVKPATPSPFLWRAYLTALQSAAMAGDADATPTSTYAPAAQRAEAEFRSAFPAADPAPIFRPTA